ncbi:MAG: hypothetical protein IKX54_00820 [Lachnospiraceae bacterium]|nr:hypothetical protein [Lachnospiraceae bacterium]
MGFFDDLKKTVTKALGGTETPSNVSQDILFADIPTSLEAMKALPYANMQSPYAVAALCICALNIFPTDENTAVAMMNYLKGHDALSPMDVAFIRDRFRDNNAYKVRSYFKGATPQNNYMPSSPYTITVSENPYSRTNFADGYLTLWIASGGADTPRQVTLRQKKSTGEWFIFSDSFKGLLADIRVPAEQDPWA